MSKQNRSKLDEFSRGKLPQHQSLSDNGVKISVKITSKKMA